MKTTAPQQSYRGATVYVGIDVHKRTYSVVVRVQGREVKRWTTAAVPQQLGQQLRKFFAGAQIKSAYEAGFSGYELHRELMRQGLDSRRPRRGYRSRGKPTGENGPARCSETGRAVGGRSFAGVPGALAR